MTGPDFAQQKHTKLLHHYGYVLASISEVHGSLPSFHFLSLYTKGAFVDTLVTLVICNGYVHDHGRLEPEVETWAVMLILKLLGI